MPIFRRACKREDRGSHGRLAPLGDSFGGRWNVEVGTPRPSKFEQGKVSSDLQDPPHRFPPSASPGAELYMPHSPRSASRPTLSVTFGMLTRARRRVPRQAKSSIQIPSSLPPFFSHHTFGEVNLSSATACKEQRVEDEAKSKSQAHNQLR